MQFRSFLLQKNLTIVTTIMNLSKESSLFFGGVCLSQQQVTVFIFSFHLKIFFYFMKFPVTVYLYHYQKS